MYQSVRREDTSSDDSDDIPPTPAAKSTPIAQPDRFRKHSTTSESSSSIDHPQTPKFSKPARRETDSDSSSGEKEAPRSHIKQENKSPEESDSSSEEESNTIRAQPASHQSTTKANRSYHSSSSSGSEDPGKSLSAVRNQPNPQYSSSEDSSDEEAERKLPNNPVKIEGPSTSSSSEDDSDEDGRVIGGSLPVAAPLPRYYGKESDSSSEDEDVGNRQQKGTNQSSSEESGDQAVHRKSSPNAAHHEDTSSESETEAVPNPVSLTSNSHVPAFQNNDSSDEDSSADERKPISKPSPSLPVQQHQDESSDQETSDDEASNQNLSQGPKHNSSVQVNHLNANSSNEDSSDDNAAQIRKPAATTDANFKFQQKSSEEDSSEDEDQETSKPSVSSQHEMRADSSDEEEPEIKFNPADVSISKPKPTETTEMQSLAPIFRTQIPVPGKRGKLLLEETFKGREHLEVDNPLLTAEDIGSDDEVWLLQCPKSMDISALKKRKISLGTISDIQLEDGQTFKRFSVTPEENSTSVNCLLPSHRSKFRISCLPIKGKVLIQEHVHVPKLRLPEASAKGPVPFPNGLKVRHPLLGVGFQDHIAKVQKALKESAKQMKSKKGKRSSGNDFRRGSNSGTLQNSSYEDTASQFSSHFGEKQKHKTYNNSSFNSEVYNKSKDERSRKKEKRQESVSNNSVDGSFLNDTYKKKHKKSKKDDQDGNNMTANISSHRTSWHIPPSEDTSASLSTADESYIKKKKSKKAKKDVGIEGLITSSYGEGLNGHRKSWHVPQTNELTTTFSGNEESHSKKKHKKSKKDSELLAPSEIKQELNDSVHLNGITNTFIAKEKKRKRKEGYEEDHSLDDAQTPSKKKKYSV